MRTRLARAAIAPLGLLAIVGALSSDALTASGLPVGGGGGGAVSGYTVSGVSYRLGRGDTATLAGVSFQIEPRHATMVRVRLVSGASWYPCQSAAGRVTCTTGAPAVALTAVERLDVQATG